MRFCPAKFLPALFLAENLKFK